MTGGPEMLRALQLARTLPAVNFEMGSHFPNRFAMSLNRRSLFFAVGTIVPIGRCDGVWIAKMRPTRRHSPAFVHGNGIDAGPGAAPPAILLSCWTNAGT